MARRAAALRIEQRRVPGEQVVKAFTLGAGLERADRHHQTLEPGEGGGKVLGREFQLAAILGGQAHQAIGQRMHARVEELAIFQWATQQADAKEGIQAFFQKRQPDFSQFD